MDDSNGPAGHRASQEMANGQQARPSPIPPNYEALTELEEREKNYSKSIESRDADQPMDKDVYRVVNTVMQPILVPHGYSSFAQFERAYEECGGDPPWPRKQ